ncbi:hypothetical protein HPP92_005082 [Vanilla planifolia]|uniref:CRIB domain-containing protein n=1 Tax=Vanilla planifolia TaxID=51239 RepID=A0A835RY22_VANPL|nr:hypothetical protein HPP92_005082 [Vanilla planifolia]
MGTRMKGLIKGLRQISNIFDSKEQEMQIGYPTDVKHVAHIGWDGPSENPPSWMHDFASPPLAAAAQNAAVSSESVLTGEPSVRKSREKTEKSSRRKKSSEADSSTSKHHRHRQCSTGSSGGESSEGSRRNWREAKEGSSEDGDAVHGEQDLPGIPKQSRRRKAKGSSTMNGGALPTSSSSRSKSLLNVDQGTQEESGEFIPQPTRPAKVSEGVRTST